MQIDFIYIIISSITIVCDDYLSKWLRSPEGINYSTLTFQLEVW